MNTRLIIIIIAVVVVGALFFLWSGDREQNGAFPAGQNGGEYADAPLAPDALAGMWRSVDDPAFTRTIYENGGYVDAHEGIDTSVNGPWVTFTAETAPLGFQYTAQPGVTYLELIDESGPLYFSIAELTEERLVLIYLDRGGVLEFERVVP